MSAMAMKKLFAKAQASPVFAAYLELNLHIVFPNLSGSINLGSGGIRTVRRTSDCSCA